MSSLVVWCHPTPPPPNFRNVVLWEAFLPDGASDDWISLPMEVRRRRHELRRRYSEWIHAVGTSPRRGRPLRATLTTRAGFSYWWMSTPACNALGSNSPVYRAVRFMALDQIADEFGATHIEIYSTDGAVAATVKSWARHNKRTARWHRQRTRRKSTITNNRFEKLKTRMIQLFPPLGALSILLHLARAQSTGRSIQQTREPDQLLFVDYLAHLSKPALDRERFASNFWGPLVDVVEQNPPVTWLHLSPSRPSTASLTREKKIIDSWGSRPGVNHDLLHTRLTRAIAWRAVRDYSCNALRGLRLWGKRELYRESTSGIPLWLTFKDDFRDEWYGSTAMLNALYINLFNDYLATGPRAKVGVYLFEGQPWEAAFVHAWRKHGYGKLIGFAHSSILFWDTRIFQDSRDLVSASPSGSHCWPDRIAVTSSAMRDLLIDGEFPSKLLADVEGVRFLSTQPAIEGERADMTRILILGEYSWDATARMLNIIEPVLAEPQNSRSVKLRLHPACRPQWSHPPTWLNLDTKDSAAAALAESDVVICGPLTSAAVDSAARDLPTILVADPHVFPGSPAEQWGAEYVYSSSELGMVLKSLPPDIHQTQQSQGASEVSSKIPLNDWLTLLNLE